MSGASAQRGGHHRGVGGASQGRGIGTLSLSMHSVLSLRRCFFLVGGVTIDSAEERCQHVKPPEAKRKF